MTTDTTPGSARREDAEAQRHTLVVLVAAQILSGAGLAAGVTVGSLLAQDMLESTSLAGLPSALGTAGSVLAAIAVGRISQARGRRLGLATGYLAGAIGSAGVVVGAALGNAAVLFVALFVYGAGMSTNLLARYAGADLAKPTHRARAVSTVLVATTLGGVAGPNLAAPTGELADSLGVPYLAGPFLLAGTAYALAALILAVWLRPDPLLLARTLESRHPAVASTEDPGIGGRRTGVVVGATVMVLTQLVMVAVMTMTPVHIHDHGGGTAASGVVIAIHLGAMYLPSLLTGPLVDRYGPLGIAAASGLVLLAAGIVAASAPADSVAALATALGLLGFGWNLGLVSGTAIVTEATPPARRAKTQGLVDVFIAIAGAAGGMISGVVVAGIGYPALALGGGLLALIIVPVAVAAGRSDCRPR